MPIRTFLRKFARACRYRTDAADQLQRGNRRCDRYQSSLCGLLWRHDCRTVPGYVNHIPPEPEARGTGFAAARPEWQLSGRIDGAGNDRVRALGATQPSATRVSYIRFPPTAIPVGCVPASVASAPGAALASARERTLSRMVQCLSPQRVCHAGGHATDWDRGGWKAGARLQDAFELKAVTSRSRKVTVSGAIYGVFVRRFGEALAPEIGSTPRPSGRGPRDRCPGRRSAPGTFPRQVRPVP